MSDGRSPNTLNPLKHPLLYVVALLAFSGIGCTGHRPNLALNGSLKTALSQVQFENETLKAKVAKLDKQNRMLAADLQREETYSGTLAARLDESRIVMKRSGVNLPMDEESPRVIAQAGDSPTERVTFGQVAGPRPRRSKYADWPDDTTDEKKKTSDHNTDDDVPINDSYELKKPKSLRPQGFPEDPESQTEEVPALSANDLSTGWRRLSYRDSRVKTGSDSAP